MIENDICRNRDKTLLFL